MLKDPENDFFVDPAGYDQPAQYDEAIHRELEARDYDSGKNVFWGPALALRSDDTLVVNRTRVATGVSPLPNLAGLIDLIATIPFQHAHRNSSRQSAGATDAKDILGHDSNPSPSNSPSASLGDLCALAVKYSSSSMAIRGIDFDFGKEPADTFTRDQHPDRSSLRQSAAATTADFVMALPSAAARSLPRSHPADRPNGRINPPFNIKECFGPVPAAAQIRIGVTIQVVKKA